MNIETLKISVFELTKGMHVVRLDRPWLETPFKLQGFRITSSKEIRTLEKYCKHVYVDVQRGVAPPRGKGEKVILSEDGELLEGSPTIARVPSSGANKPASNADQTALPPPAVEYNIESTFEAEMPIAQAAVRACKNALKNFMKDLAEGRRGGLEPVRLAAESLEATALRNPDPVMLIRALKSDEPFSFRHCVNSAILGITLARALGFKKQTIHELTMGVLLADMGKLRIPGSLLRATRRLDVHETKIIQEHVPLGVELAEALEGLTPGTIEIIAAHHERFNGSGYPAGLRGGEIPLLARIAGLVDSFDAITSERTYSDAIPIYEAVQEMYAATVDVFQRDIVEKLIQVLGTYPVGSLVELSDGAVALVVALNPQRRLLPKVMYLTDNAKQATAGSGVVDLAGDAAGGVTVRDVLDPGQHGIEQPSLDLIAA